MAVQQPGAPVPSGELVRCEDCSRTPVAGERGWIQVRYPFGNRQQPDPIVHLYYCPSHAGQFDLADADVSPVPANGSSAIRN